MSNEAQTKEEKLVACSCPNGSYWVNHTRECYESRLKLLRLRINELELSVAEAKGQIETLDRSNHRLRRKLDLRTGSAV